MFKNLASDALGLSDIGKIIPPSQFHQTDIDDYIFHEDDEKIYFVIKSKSDEYCFTNVAFIHLDGQSASSKKRNLKRYLYRDFVPAYISIETAGTIDRDVELKFSLTHTTSLQKDVNYLSFSIDVDKTQIEQVRDIYKALTAIEQKCKKIDKSRLILDKSYQSVVGMFSLKDLPEAAVLKLPSLINQTIAQIEKSYSERLDEINHYDFSQEFEHYLRS